MGGAGLCGRCVFPVPSATRMVGAVSYLKVAPLVGPKVRRLLLEGTASGVWAW